MPDDMSAIAAPANPSAVDMALAGGPAMGPTPDPNAPTPMMQPPQAQPQPPQTGPVQMTATPVPPTAPTDQQMPVPPQETQQHMGMLHRALNAVANLLGGPITYKVQTGADGSVQIAPEPSTTGEKWGRIAANALGGLATGLQNAQGPGGFAKAAAAGTQYGLAQPQKQLEQVEQQGEVAQQMQMRNAQKALIQQKIAQNTFEAKARGIAFNQAQSDRANGMQDWILANPTNKEVDAFGNMQDAMDYEKLHGDLISGHTHGMFHTETMPDGKVHLYTLDQAWLDQKSDKDFTYQEPVIKEDGTIGFAPHTVPRGVHTNRELEQISEAAGNKSLEYGLKLADLDEKNQTAQTTAEERRQNAQWQHEDRQTAAATRAQEHADSVALQRQIAEGKGYLSGTPTPPAPAGSYDPAHPPVQNFAKGTVGIVPKNIGKVPAKVTTNADLSRNILENTDAAEKIMQRRPDLFGPAAGRMTNFDEMAGSNDADMRALAQQFSNIAKATVGIHGSRSVDLVHDEETKLFNRFKAGINGTRGALEANRTSAQTFIDTERNFQQYGSSTGPDRSLDVSRPKQQQQQGTGQGGGTQGGNTGFNWGAHPVAQ